MDDILENIRKKRHLLLTNDQIPISDITDVIVILGSSRSGSTLLHKLISEHPQINSLSGEEQTYFNLCGLQSIEDDRLLNQKINYELLASEILMDIGSERQNIPLNEIKRRLLLQWPELSLNEEFLNFDYHSSTLDFIKTFNLPINLYENKLTEHVELDPQHQIIEEPPFLLPTQHKKYTKRNKNFLLLKSSSNAYRMNHICQLFPNAKYHYIFIKRDVKQVVNGLIDGWNSSGFHSHYFENQLNITHYDSKSWWKFDLPPRWKEYSNKDLIDVATFQWQSAYTFILDFLKDKKYHSINYDDFYDHKNLSLKLDSIFKKIDIPVYKLKTLPQTMTTSPPSLHRWEKRKEVLLPMANQKEIKEFNDEVLAF